jgi:hypothetical protein
LQSQAINGTLASFDYGLDLPKEIAIDTANALLNRKLAEAKYKVGYDPETNSISLLTEAGMLAYENNTPVDFKGFASRVLADNNFESGGPRIGNPATQTRRYRMEPGPLCLLPPLTANRHRICPQSQRQTGKPLNHSLKTD